MSIENPTTVYIETGKFCYIGNFKVEIISYLGCFSDVNYFKVIIHEDDNNNDSNDDINHNSSNSLGLLRIGEVDGRLKQELDLRSKFGNQRMVSDLLLYKRFSVDISLSPTPIETNINAEVDGEAITDLPSYSEDESKTNTNVEVDGEAITDSPTDSPKDSEDNSSENSDKIVSSKKDSPPLNNINQTSKITLEKENLEQTDSIISEENEDNSSEYLEEEYYPEKEIGGSLSGTKLIFLSKFPQEEETLAYWLQQEHTLEECLLTASQLCQFFRQITKEKWYFVNLLPQFIKQTDIIEFFDLTGAYQSNETVNTGFISKYSPPEILSNPPHEICEQMSSYIVGLILYEALHKQLPPASEGIIDLTKNIDIIIKKIPRIFQILQISLSIHPEERFNLSYLLELLITTRKYLANPKVRWEIANRSTLGLSTKRLNNEDNYGILQPSASNTESLVLAVVADGMGGMSQGDVASKTAVESILETSIPEDLTTSEKRTQWLFSLVEKANKSVYEKVKNGGTTISLALVVGRNLNIAHVGDSRIYLIRKGIMCQISEDHSLVAMLVANGDITYEESLVHPNRSVLMKSLGSNPRIRDDYVQDLSHFGDEFLSFKIQQEDILILCSDGIWNLLSNQELVEIFNQEKDLQTAVNQTVEKVIENGADDNATIVALKCHLEDYSL